MWVTGHKAEAEDGEVFCLERAPIPVSYTHLDVYKRQLNNSEE